MELSVYNITGKETSKKVQLNDEIFAIEPNDHCIYLDVKQHLANKRQGTHKSKERCEVSGSTRKIKKQKGTGGARAGDINNPLFRGGGRVFGPRPRDYEFKLNKKVKRLARKSALTYKAKANNIIVLEDFNFDEPKTKKQIELLNNFQLSNEKTLVVVNGVNNNVFLSARNLKKVRVVSANEINTYDIMNANKMIVVESSIKLIEDSLNN